jgi:hypothetical protein
MSQDTYYPSCVVHLNLRFESKLNVRAQLLDGSYHDEPLVTQRNNGTFVKNRVPRKATVHYQGHTQAATWTLVFAYRELPIDPRTIAAATVEIYLGTVSADDFSQGMQREISPGVRRSILQTRDASGLPIDENLLIVGLVDTWTVEHGESGAEVHLEGRDLRGLLLDSPLVAPQDTFDYARPRPARRKKRSSILDRLRTDQPIDVLVNQILSEHSQLNALPEAERIRAVAFPAEWPSGVVQSPGQGSHIPRHRRGASGAGSAAGAAHSSLNFWDIITRYCQPGDALVCKSDLTWAPIAEIKVGDTLLGYAKDQTAAAQRKYHKYSDSTVEEVFVRKAPVVALHMASGRVVRCTPDHHWFTGRSEPVYEFAMPAVGRDLVRVFDHPKPAREATEEYKLGYVRGLIEGDAAVVDRTYFDENGVKKSRTKGIFLAMNDEASLARYKMYLRDLGIRYTEGVSRSGPQLTYTQSMVRACTQKALDTLVFAPEPTESKEYLRGWLAGMFDAEGCTSNGLEICQYRRVNPATWNKIRCFLQHFGFITSDFEDRIKVQGGVKEMLRFFDLTQPAAVFKFRRHVLGARMTGAKDRILRIEELGEENVYSLKTSTGTYIGQGYASRNCYLVGAVPSFVGRTLQIRYAPTLYDMINGQDERIPFRGNQPRLDPDGTARNTRALVYGRDIDTMKIARRYSGNNKPKTVRVICVNPSSTGRGREQLMESVWPPRNVREARREGVSGDNRTVRDFVGGQESSEIANIPVRGVSSQAQLDSIARAYYENIGRNEITGEVATGRMNSFGGNNADPDMLRLRVGDPLELLVDASTLRTHSPITAALNRTVQLPFTYAVAEVRQFLHDENLSRAIAATAQGNIMGVLRYFRVSGVDYEWSDDSISIKADIQNYWTPRWDFGTAEELHARRTQHATDHSRGTAAAEEAAQATLPRSAPNATQPVRSSVVSRRSATASYPDQPATTQSAPQHLRMSDTLMENITDTAPVDGEASERWRSGSGGSSDI